jgi:hypothetical protein
MPTEHLQLTHIPEQKEERVQHQVEYRFDVARATRGARTELYLLHTILYKCFSIDLSFDTCFISVT